MKVDAASGVHDRAERALALLCEHTGAARGACVAAPPFVAALTDYLLRYGVFESVRAAT